MKLFLKNKKRAHGTEKSQGLTHNIQGTTMALPIGCLTTLNNPEYVETWIRCFEALARVKKLRDRQSEMDPFHLTCVHVIHKKKPYL